MYTALRLQRQLPRSEATITVVDPQVTLELPIWVTLIAGVIKGVSEALRESR